MLRNRLKLAALAPLSLLLWQCHAAEKPKATAPSPYAVSVRLAYTPMALAALIREKDTVGVDAYYYGDPKPEAQSKADKLGRLALADELHGWSPDTRRVPFGGNIDTSLLPDLRDEPQLLVSADSIGSDGGSDQLIACKTWIGTVKNAQAKPPLIACELDTGDKDSADAIIAADEASSSESSQ
jgi:hypothetical protein